MDAKEIRKEIRDLKKSIICQHEPFCKAFIGIKGRLSTNTRIAADRRDHLHTRVVLLTRRDCGKLGYIQRIVTNFKIK